MPARFLRAAADLEPGHHACLVYDADEARRDTVQAFLDRGVERGEKLLYVAGGNAFDDDIVAHVALSAAPGQLDAVPADAVYPDVFDAEGMVAGFAAAAGAAVSAGYPALRAVGAVPAPLLHAAGPRAVAAYERDCDGVFGDGTLVSLCEYDCRAVGADIVTAALDAHPGAVYALGGDGAPAVIETRPDGARIGGWVGFGSVGRLADALVTLLGAGGDVTVDLSECTYVDVAAVRVFVAAASELHAKGSSLTLLDAPASVVSVLPLVGWDETHRLRLV